MVFRAGPVGLCGIAVALALLLPWPGAALPDATSSGHASSGHASSGLASGPARDTILPLGPGERLELRGLSGRVRIDTWDGSGVLLRLEDDRRPPRVVRLDDGLRLDGRGRDGYTVLRVPPDTRLELRGRDVEVEVRGLRASVGIRTVDGAVRIDDVRGDVEVHTVDGEVVLVDVTGAVRVVSVDEDIRVRRGRGDFHLASTDADVEMVDVEGSLVDASSTGGDVTFRGRVLPEGTVRLSSHGGDLDVVIPEGEGARIHVATWGGSFEPAMPLTATELVSDRETEFLLGGGGGALVLKSFSGDIRLSHGR